MTFNILVVGTGKIARMHAGAMAMIPEVSLGGVVSRDLTRAQAFAADFGSVAAFSDLTEALSHPDVQGVYIATPTGPKEEIALAAMRAGKHVLVEKPLASAASAERLAAAAREHGVTVIDATHFTHNPRTAALQAQMPEDIGTPLSLSASFQIDLADDSNIRYDTNLEPHGALGDLGWYCARAVVELLQPKGPLIRTETEGEFRDGALIAATGFWVFESGERASFDCNFGAGTFVQDLVLSGTEGVITMDDFVHDWERGRIGAEQPDTPAGYTLRQGRMTRATAAYRETPAAQSHVLSLLQNFVTLAKAPAGEASQAAQQRMIATQALVDATFFSSPQNDR